MKLKRNIKDSVFSKLFRNKSNLLALFLILHPEFSDNDLSENDFEEKFIEYSLIDGIKNDLSFSFRDKFLILVEAQSKWNKQMPIRLLQYYTGILLTFRKDKKINIYSLKPEFYVVCTDSRYKNKKVIVFKESFPRNGQIFVKVAVIREDGTNSVLDQYCRFCRMEREESEKGFSGNELAVRILDRCLKENVLKDFILENREELEDIMLRIYDEEYELEQALARAHAEGEARGETRGKIKVCRSLLQRGLSITEASNICGLEESELPADLKILLKKSNR